MFTFLVVWLDLVITLSVILTVGESPLMWIGLLVLWAPTIASLLENRHD